MTWSSDTIIYLDSTCHLDSSYRNDNLNMQATNEKHLASDMVESVEHTGSHPFADDDVHWWRQQGLRRLYLLMPFLFLGSTTLGYDGSLLNGLQAMPSWQQCMLEIQRHARDQTH